MFLSRLSVVMSGSGFNALFLVAVLLFSGSCAMDMGGALRAGPQPQEAPRHERAAAAASATAAEQGSEGLRSALQRLDERIARHPGDYEAVLLKGLLYYEARRYERALEELRGLVARAPNFHLAQMVLGDMLLSRVGRVSGMGYNPILAAMPDSRYPLVDDLRAEARMRLRAYRERRDGGKERVPGQLLRLGNSVESAILVDKEGHRLYLFLNRGEEEVPQLLYDFYVSTGRGIGDKVSRGDLRTPEGVYFVTRYIPDRSLPEKYGVGAFPINYPNELDRYRRKTGGGIWLHGLTRRFYSRPPLDSEGCVVLSNLDLEQIKELISPGKTPVIIAEHLEWLERDLWELRRAEVLEALQRWRSAWENADARRYLASYAPDFRADDYDFDSWSAMKRRLFTARGRRHIVLDDVSLLAYGGLDGAGREMVVADFRLRYEGGGTGQEWRKRLYLVRETERWQVLYESNVLERDTKLAGSAVPSPG
ncbi:MAG TPA: hypothetical protein ENJ43_04010 [Gammaproteobacteria bacterium]|nr:hypothetical protein [Gammaproteobacteria bacterium]